MSSPVLKINKDPPARREGPLSVSSLLIWLLVPDRLSKRSPLVSLCSVVPGAQRVTVEDKRPPFETEVFKPDTQSSNHWDVPPCPFGKKIVVRTRKFLWKISEGTSSLPPVGVPFGRQGTLLVQTYTPATYGTMDPGLRRFESDVCHRYSYSPDTHMVTLTPWQGRPRTRDSTSRPTCTGLSSTWSG